MERKKNNVPSMFWLEAPVFRAVIEEAVALASLALFLGTVAIWAQVLSSMS